MNPRRVLALIAALTAVVLLLLRCSGPDLQSPSPPVVDAPTPLHAQVSEVETPNSVASRDSAPKSPTPSEHASRQRTPSTVNGPDGPGAIAAAFAQAWTRHRGADTRTWPSRLNALSTSTLSAELAGVDPGTVPADTVTGPAGVTLATITGWAQASVPTNTGTLQLSLQHSDRWRVDTLDWTPR